MRALVVLLPVLAACGSAVKRDLDAALAAASATSPTPEADPRPDLRGHLTSDALAALVAHGASRLVLGASLDLGDKVRIDPSFRVVRAAVVPAGRRCEGCLGLDLTLDAALAWRAMPPLAVAGRIDATVRAVLDVSLDARADDEGALDLLATVEAVRELDASVPKAAGPVMKLVAAGLGPALTAAARGAWGSPPPLVLGTLGSAAVPIQAVRAEVRPDGSLDVLAYTTAPRRFPAPAAVPPGDGLQWSVALPVPTALALAERALLRGPPAAEGFAVTLRDASLADDVLTVDLRLWRTAGFAWWRDYRVRVELRFGVDSVRLNPVDVLELAHSPGAGAAGAAVALARDRVREALRDVLRRTVPVATRGDGPVDVGLRRLTARTDAAGEPDDRDGGVWLVEGALDISP